MHLTGRGLKFISIIKIIYNKYCVKYELSQILFWNKIPLKLYFAVNWFWNHRKILHFFLQKSPRLRPKDENHTTPYYSQRSYATLNGHKLLERDQLLLSPEIISSLGLSCNIYPF